MITFSSCVLEVSWNPMLMRKNVCLPFNIQSPVERWRREARGWENSKMYRSKINPGLRIPSMALPAVCRLWPSERKKNVIYSPYLSCLGRSALKGSNIVGFVPWPFCRTEVFMILMLVIYFSTIQGSLKVWVPFIDKRQLKMSHFAWSLRFQSVRTYGVNCNVTNG